MALNIYALVDASNVIQRLVNWNGVDTPSQFSPLTPVIIDPTLDPIPGDIFVGGVLTRGTPLDLQNRRTQQNQINSALARLRQIRDANQIQTANLAAVQALQAAVQDEARVLISLVRLSLNHSDGVD